MIDWPDGEIALQFLERLLHFGELNVKGPQFCRGLAHKIGTQQIPAFVTAAGTKPFTIQHKGEGFRGDGLASFGKLDGDEAGGAPSFLLRSPDFQEQLIPRRRLSEQLFEPRPEILELLTPHGALLEHAALALGEDVNLAFPLQKLDADGFSRLVPGLAKKIFFKRREPSLRRAKR